MRDDRVMQARDKRFLNDSYHEHGAVSWEIFVHKCNYDGELRICGDLRIQDCHDLITLDFNSANTPADKRIAKIDNLIESLMLMREAYVEAAELMDKDNAPKKFIY